MPFRFRLEKVLTWRQRLVDRKALELAEAGRRTAEAESRVRALDADIARHEQSAPAGRGGLSVTGRVQLARWIEHLRSQRETLMNELACARDEEARRRDEMVAAWQDLEVLKKLKQKRREEWRAEMQKRENADLDEIGVQRADRRRREELATV